MSFLNLSGLWLLLGVPLLIFLYIIKQKYTDRILASSFIWRKSAPFIKKNIRLRKLLRYLLFILQILVIIFSALVLARPISSAQATTTKYIVILDSSGSMQAEQDGKSRFTQAINKTADLASNMVNGSTMSIICTGDTASFAVKDTESEAIVRKALSKLECGWSESDITGAVAMAMKEKSDTIPTNIILYTDTDYIDAGDIQVVNLSKEETNAVALSLTASESKNGGFTFTGTVASYGKSDTLTVGLYLDGILKDAKMVECDEDIFTEIIFEQTDVETYSQAKIIIENKDSIANDNQYVLVNDTSSEMNILIVSTSPLFIKTALGAVGDFNVKTTETLDKIPLPTEESGVSGASEEQYGELADYDLYIFDGIIPDALPDDGAVWLINPQTLPLETGLVIGDAGRNSGISALVNKSSKTYTTLTQNLDLKNIAVSDYTQLTDYTGYEAILACNGSPVLLAKESNDYKKTMVLMFDIHNSNLPLLPAFPLLIQNMTNYSMPSMLNQRDYVANSSVSIAALPGALSIKVVDASGNENQLALNADGSIFTPTAPGLYTVKQITSGSLLSDTIDSFFVHMNTAESNTWSKTVSLGLGESTMEIQQTNGFFDSVYSTLSMVWPLVIILLLIILLIEWGLYYREEL